MKALTAQRLREVVSYDAATGCFVRVGTGKPAGTVKSNGYLHFSVDGKKYGAHRLAWLFVHGAFPEGDIDHIDGDRKNNAIGNLRDVCRAVNLQNLRVAKSHNKSTGLLGAYFHKPSGRYTSRIQSMGKDKHLGMFDTAEAAHAAYLAAKRSMHEGNTL